MYVLNIEPSDVSDLDNLDKIGGLPVAIYSAF
jgi:hypothetical protein